MNKKILFAEMKVYAYLYLMTAPFTYLVTKVSNIYMYDDELFLVLNIFIALALWMYIKKIRPLLNEKGTSGINMLLVLLVIITILFSVKSASLSSELASELETANSELYNVNNKLEDLESKLEDLEYTVSSMQYDISDIKDEVENR